MHVYCINGKLIVFFISFQDDADVLGEVCVFQCSSFELIKYMWDEETLSLVLPGMLL